MAGDFNGDGRLDLAFVNFDSNVVSIVLSNGDGTFSDPGLDATTPHATPARGRRQRRRHRGCPGRRWRRRHPLPPGHPRPARNLRAARDGQPPLPTARIPIPRATSPGCPNTLDGPLLASVDAQDDAISLYAYRDGSFVRIGSLHDRPAPGADHRGRLERRPAGTTWSSATPATAPCRSTIATDRLWPAFTDRLRAPVPACR